MRLAVFGCCRFDHVGVDRALRQPANAVDLARFAIEDIDEGRANDFSFGFRILDTRELGEEFLFGVDGQDVERLEFSRGDCVGKSPAGVGWLH